jgi:hydrogenase maturation protease
MEQSGSIAVIGIGNILLSDDGAGPTVVRLLEAEYDFPLSVELLDLGTPTLDLTSRLTGRRAVILIDAVRADGVEPGLLRHYDKGGILAGIPQPRMSPHEPSLRDALALAEVVGDAPEQVVLVGVVPASVEDGTGLSEAARRGCRRACDAVLAELAALGVEVVAKDRPGRPDLWWEPEERRCSSAYAA